MKYIVYITKNTVNDKRYIGVHKTKDPEVFDGYIGCGCYINKPSSYNNPITPFQHAVKKYGPSKFIRTIIKVFNNEEDAYNLEAELVTKDIVRSKNYYNVALGGFYPKRVYKIIYQYNLLGEFIREWEIDEAVDIYPHSRNSFGYAAKHHNKLSGFYWSYEKVEKLNMEEYSHPNIPKVIYEYSSEGVCIGVYDSLHEFNSPGRVSTAIQTKRAYKGNFYSYTFYEEYKPEIKQNLRGVSIYIYNKDGSFYTEVIGVTQAMNAVKGKSRECVYNAINTGNPYKGFKFLLEKKEKIEPFTTKNDAKPVNVYDIYGNFIRDYTSLNEAMRDLKLDSSSAHKVVKGTQTQTKGYILRYK